MNRTNLHNGSTFSATVTYLGVLPWQQSLGGELSGKRFQLTEDKEFGSSSFDCSTAEAVVQ